MHPLHRHVAEILHRDAPVIGAHWQAQARTVAPRPADVAAIADPVRALRVVRAVATALGTGPCGHQDLVRAGWELGAASHGDELSLHYLLKELDLLSAILLYAAERAMAELPAEVGAAGPAEGMGVARRLHKGVSLLTLAASKGFTHGYLAELRDHYRTLRHDLRNPLGTIRSAITLMEDESVAPEMRNDPRFRAMVVRNAHSIDRLIGRQLGDDAIQGSALARQAVSLHEVARAVRRSLRDEAEDRSCEIRVEEGLPTRALDSVGVELALRALVAEVLDAAAPGATVVLRAVPTTRDRAAIAVLLEGPVQEAVATQPLAPVLMEEIGGWCDGVVTGSRAAARVEFPAIEPMPDEAADAAAPAPRPAAASARQQGQDVARPHEGAHP